jgi:KTSC domain
MVKAAASLILLMLTAPFGTEAVEVRGRGPVDLATFECRDITRSTIVQRACYDSAQHQLIVAIKGNYEQYCGLAMQTFDSFMSAPSMGRFFIDNIRGRAPDDRYGCSDRRRGY